MQHSADRAEEASLLNSDKMETVEAFAKSTDDKEVRRRFETSAASPRLSGANREHLRGDSS